MAILSTIEKLVKIEMFWWAALPMICDSLIRHVAGCAKKVVRIHLPATFWVSDTFLGSLCSFCFLNKITAYSIRAPINGNWISILYHININHPLLTKHKQYTSQHPDLNRSKTFGLGQHLLSLFPKCTTLSNFFYFLFFLLSV